MTGDAKIYWAIIFFLALLVLAVWQNPRNCATATNATTLPSTPGTSHVNNKEVEPEPSAHAIPPIKIITPSPNKLAFFDLGGAFGDSLTAFIEGTAAHVGGSKFKPHPTGDWDYWIFEANPKFSPTLKALVDKYRTTLPTHRFFLNAPAAIGLRDGDVTFYVSPSSACNDCGSSVLKVHDRVWHDEGSAPIPVTVPMLNLIRLLKENYTPADYVILKIDVEGLEYPILRQILLDGMASYIDEIYCEFHAVNADAAHRDTLKWIFAESGTILHDWG